MVNIKDVIGDCKCLDVSFKNNIIELLEETIKDEGDKLWKLKEGSPKFNFISEKQGNHEELLNDIRPISTCKY